MPLVQPPPVEQDSIRPNLKALQTSEATAWARETADAEGILPASDDGVDAWPVKVTIKLS